MTPVDAIDPQSLESERYTGLVDVPICDPHHHLFGPGARQYDIADLLLEGSALPLERSIFVECGEHYDPERPPGFASVGESAWVREIAETSLIEGIIAQADVTRSDLSELLDAHEAASGGLLCGVRHATAWDDDPMIAMSHANTHPGQMAEPTFRRGLTTLAARGLPFDAFVYFHQMGGVARMAHESPETVIVLDHLGGLLGIGGYAGRRDDVREQWRQLLPLVAAQENVRLKIGGLGRPLVGIDWGRPASDVTGAEIAAIWRDDILWAIDQFGVERCMFESNFPVDRQSFTYQACWEAFALISVGFSEEERRALFHDSAVATYLNPASSS